LVATGYAGHGLLMAPPRARSCTFCLGRESGYDIGPFALERFGTTAGRAELNIV